MHKVSVVVVVKAVTVKAGQRHSSNPRTFHFRDGVCCEPAFRAPSGSGLTSDHQISGFDPGKEDTENAQQGCSETSWFSWVWQEKSTQNRSQADSPFGN